MAIELDEVDIRLLRELEENADRPNVELARLVGLSPAATLNRVRRLKEAGVITGIHAHVDPARAGFPLQVFVLASLVQNDAVAHRRFEAAVGKISNVISADWVTGETDALLHVVARNIEELQKVLMTLSGRGGAARMVTLLRLEPLKPRSPLPVTR
ncbi:MAG: Lrp/AsnC family transcriptional regulator, leucine-responsive regulatory protein [Thermoleophilaceae bacterium]|jgi:Lrp/AsnC family leucine-responsive transcriptional regulator|nr:Lrp/AsnC family transcriptional regulator, leucine-responsive regulatory protein [Thermoleophilaceae bacterium]